MLLRLLCRPMLPAAGRPRPPWFCCAFLPLFRSRLWLLLAAGLRPAGEGSVHRPAAGALESCAGPGHPPPGGGVGARHFHLPDCGFRRSCRRAFAIWRVRGGKCLATLRSPGAGARGPLAGPLRPLERSPDVHAVGDHLLLFCLVAAGPAIVAPGRRPCCRLAASSIAAECCASVTRCNSSVTTCNSFDTFSRQKELALSPFRCMLAPPLPLPPGVWPFAATGSLSPRRAQRAQRKRVKKANSLPARQENLRDLCALCGSIVSVVCRGPLLGKGQTPWGRG